MATKVKVYFKDGFSAPLILDGDMYETTREGHLIVRRPGDAAVIGMFAAGLWAAVLTAEEKDAPAPQQDEEVAAKPAARRGRPPKVASTQTRGTQKLPLDLEDLPNAPVPPLGMEG